MRFKNESKKIEPLLLESYSSIDIFTLLSSDPQNKLETFFNLDSFTIHNPIFTDMALYGKTNFSNEFFWELNSTRLLSELQIENMETNYDED